MQPLDRRLMTEETFFEKASSQDSRLVNFDVRIASIETLGGLAPGDVSDATVTSLMAQAESGLRQEAGKHFASRDGVGVLASDHGAVGDNVYNDWWTISAALEAAKGKDVILEGGTKYRMAGTLTVPEGTDTVSIRATGAEPAELHLGADGQSYSAIKFEQTTSSATTTLAASIGIGTVGWPVADTAGIEPGMICEVVSTEPWYFDPRPETSDARKSELHRVRDTFLGKVYFDDPANDGYDVAAETVTLTFFRPIKVRLENIKVVGILPDVAEETKAVIGLEIQHADEPELINVSVENCARTGIRTFLCYRPKITGGYTARANNFYNGYGVSTDGSAHTIVRDHITFECRRSTDVTGQTVASRISTFINCTAVGGGKNSLGENYGWNEDGSLGSYQGAFGSHGPSDQTRYINCTSIRTQRSYTLLGRDEMIINMRHIGRSFGGVISCTAGTNLLVLGGWATSGYHSYKHQKSHLTGPNASINSQRPDYFIRFYPEYQMNTPYAEQHGRVILKGVTAECQGRAIFFDGHAPKGHFVVADNDWMLASAVGTDAVAMMVHQGVPEVFSKKKWFIGPNRITRDTGSGPIQIANNISLVGANVVDYAAAAPGAAGDTQSGYPTIMTPTEAVGSLKTTTVTFPYPFIDPPVVVATSQATSAEIKYCANVTKTTFQIVAEKVSESPFNAPGGWVAVGTIA